MGHVSFCCISYYSYIKPQPHIEECNNLLVVYHTIPTSNHNTMIFLSKDKRVVYHTIPTSNHNPLVVLLVPLFVVYHTIPTSNHNTDK